MQNLLAQVLQHVLLNTMVCEDDCIPCGILVWQSSSFEEFDPLGWRHFADKTDLERSLAAELGSVALVLAARWSEWTDTCTCQREAASPGNTRATAASALPFSAPSVRSTLWSFHPFLSSVTSPAMGISRDSLHKRRATGGRRQVHRKKRKFELGRPAANTRVSTFFPAALPLARFTWWQLCAST